MKFYIDLDTRKLVSGLGVRDQVSLIELKRGDSARIEVVFFRGITVVELTEPASGILGIKEAGKYDADTYLASDLAWTKEGTGASTLYVFEPSLNTAELDTLLASNDADDTNDIASVDTMFEVEWLEDGSLSSTQTITARIFNDVNKGAETGATAAPTIDAYIAARAVCYDRVQTLTTAQRKQSLINLGFPPYANLAAANAALGAFPRFYYDEAEEDLRLTTSAS